MDILSLLGRSRSFFESDIIRHSELLKEIVSASRFLVIGGAGSIGQATCKELFILDPRALHVVDISENNLVELVRDIRSSVGYGTGDFQTFTIDVDSVSFRYLMDTYRYNYVLNFSALKHVRSEKDPFTLMRLVEVNILSGVNTLLQAIENGGKKYFCVSSDKATNPVNMMGASKRIMELFLLRDSDRIDVSTARFANVAFSDGSLLHGFVQRVTKQQPLSAPFDVKRYFLTPQESGRLCVLASVIGKNRELFFPKLDETLHLLTFSEIAKRYLNSLGYEPVIFASENEARMNAKKLISQRRWPCYFFASDTTGEKDIEDFHTKDAQVDLQRFEDVGVISSSLGETTQSDGCAGDSIALRVFLDRVKQFRLDGSWNKEDLLACFKALLPEFGHRETGKYLENRM